MLYVLADQSYIYTFLPIYHIIPAISEGLCYRYVCIYKHVCIYACLVLLMILYTLHSIQCVYYTLFIQCVYYTLYTVCSTF